MFANGKYSLLYAAIRGGCAKGQEILSRKWWWDESEILSQAVSLSVPASDAMAVEGAQREDKQISYSPRCH